MSTSTPTTAAQKAADMAPTVIDKILGSKVRTSLSIHSFVRQVRGGGGRGAGGLGPPGARGGTCDKQRIFCQRSTFNTTTLSRRFGFANTPSCALEAFVSSFPSDLVWNYIRTHIYPHAHTSHTYIQPTRTVAGRDGDTGDVTDICLLEKERHSRYALPPPPSLLFLISLPPRLTYCAAFSGIVVAVSAWSIMQSDGIFPRSPDPTGGNSP